MQIRFFGSSECRECLELFVLLNKYQVDYQYIDTLEDNDETQTFCDDNEINRLPHLQFLKDEEVIVEHVGELEEEEFVEYLSNYFPNY